MALLPYFSLLFHSRISLSPDITLYYIHFEINSDPYNLIGSYWFDLLTNHTIIGSKLHFFPSQQESFTKTQQPIRFQGLFKITTQIAGK